MSQGASQLTKQTNHYENPIVRVAHNFVLPYLPISIKRFGLGRASSFLGREKNRIPSL